ncbi:MAG: hypothetical protein HOZ81_03300, partial [Streptomyces sp.]|nr:hypothetical protein [Streptomyces sp.]
IKVDYVITKWGSGKGKKNYPVPFSSGAWRTVDENPADPPKINASEPTESTDSAETTETTETTEAAGGKAVDAPKTEAAAANGTSSAIVAGVLAVAGGSVVLGGDRLRKLIKG